MCSKAHLPDSHAFIIQICSGTTCGTVINGELYLSRRVKCHLCVVMILRIYDKSIIFYRSLKMEWAWQECIVTEGTL